jgi:DNA-binding NarL/FixJ family response regulator
MPDPNYVAIVDACYRECATDNEWLSNLLNIAEPLLEHGFGYGFSMQRASEMGGPVPALTDYRRMAIDPFKDTPAAASIDPSSFRALWYPPTPVVFITALMSELSAELRPMMEAYLRAAKVGDMIGMLGHPTRDHAFVLWSGVGERGQVSARTRDVLHRLRIHVETGLRLRLAGPANAVAVILPNGKLEYAGAGARERHAREQLIEQTRVVERARSRRHTGDPHEALVAWQALIAGRWSLAERTESDGKRVYLVFENPPHAVPYRELTDIERAVVDLSGKGLAGKHVAYALGIGESSVSRHLSSAATRMGFRNRTALVRFAGRVLKAGTATADLQSSLTPAERGVLELICRGLSNHAIATARSASERTVANQVASLLRKTRAPSRRALSTLADPTSEEWKK